MKQKTRLIISLLCLFLVVSAGTGVWSALSTYGSDTAGTNPIYYEGKLLQDRGYIINNNPYVPLSVVQRYGDLSRLTVDTKEKRIAIDLSKQRILLADDVVTNFVKTYGGTVFVPMKQIDDNLYVPLNVMEQFLKLSNTITGNSIKIFRYSGSSKMARVADANVNLTTPLSANNRQASFTLTKDEIVFIEGETDQYYRIETQDGKSGYVMKSSINISDVNMAEIDFYAPKKDKYIPNNEKINLVWQYVNNVTPTPPSDKKAGIDILSPTWFDLIVNGGGAVDNKGDLGYTRTAHDKGYMVWATITNSMGVTGSTKFTTTLFNNTSLLNKAVAQYLFYSCLYEVDGINIDFEQVSDDDAAGLTAFTALLRSYTERQGLNLSIDTLIPKPWTIEYDRKALAKYVDYIAIMAYDEHYAGSPTAGSVASLPWVEEAIQETLKAVPANKILLGMPMYTRVWVVDNAGKVIRNPSASMPYIENLIEEEKLEKTWLEKEKQYFISYPNGAYTDKIWVEDSRSIANRLHLVQKYGLGGSACWQYSQSSEDIWQVFDSMLKKGKKLNEYNFN